METQYVDHLPPAACRFGRAAQLEIVDAAACNDGHVGKSVGNERLDEQKIGSLIRHDLPLIGIAEADILDLLVRAEYHRGLEFVHPSIATIVFSANSIVLIRVPGAAGCAKIPPLKTIPALTPMMLRQIMVRALIAWVFP